MENGKLYIKETEEHFVEMLDNGDDVIFEYNDHDYRLLKCGTRWRIVDANGYMANGGYSDDPAIAYPHSNEAESVGQLLDLPFLDGKTVLDRFAELKFFEW